MQIAKILNIKSYRIIICVYRRKSASYFNVPETLGVLYLEELSKDVNEILIFDTEFFD